MRVMVLIKATPDSEAGVMPSLELIQAMGAYNQQLIEAGIMRDGDGLRPSSQGKRVAFDGDSRTVIDGPFDATNELVAGYWLWQVKDMDDAIEWIKRCPNPMPAPAKSKSAPSTNPPTSPKPSPRSSPAGNNASATRRLPRHPASSRRTG